MSDSALCYLQEPIDNRHVDTIMRYGGEIVVGADTAR